MSVKKLISLTPAYVKKIRMIKNELGLSSDSEVIRRAIDVYAEEIGILKNFEKGGG